MKCDERYTEINPKQTLCYLQGYIGLLYLPALFCDLISVSWACSTRFSPQIHFPWIAYLVQLTTVLQMHEPKRVLWETWVRRNQSFKVPEELRSLRKGERSRFWLFTFDFLLSFSFLFLNLPRTSMAYTDAQTQQRRILCLERSQSKQPTDTASLAWQWKFTNDNGAVTFALRTTPTWGPGTVESPKQQKVVNALIYWKNSYW